MLNHVRFYLSHGLIIKFDFGDQRQQNQIILDSCFESGFEKGFLSQSQVRNEAKNMVFIS